MPLRPRIRAILTAALVLVAASPSQAGAATPLAAVPTVPTGAGGPTRLVGTGRYTFFGVSLIYDQPDVVLLDQSGLYVDRNIDFLAARRGQVLGRFTSDFSKPPFHYSVTLPPVPHGELRDVAHDGRQGVQIFVLQIDENFVHDRYLERGEQGSALLSSVTTQAISPEISGGALLVYAPDDGERFPSGFGPDGRLFSADDPLVTLPRGYTVVRLDRAGFRFDRSRTATLDALEDPFIAQPDLSQRGYAGAFNALIALLKQRYAYTAFRHIDWAAKRAAYYPRIARAQASHDAAAFYRAIVELAYSIHDYHTSADAPSALNHRAFARDLAAQSGYLGAFFTALDDGRVVVSDVAPFSPADQAGIAPGDQIIAVNGQPIAAVVAHAFNLSNAPRPDERHLLQVEYAATFPAGAHVTLTYRPLSGAPRTAALTAVRFPTNTSGNGNGSAPLLSTATLDGGYGYARWTSFSQPHAMLAQWEAFIRRMIAHGAPGIVLDLRDNGGGSGSLSDLMASYLFPWGHGYLDDTITSGYDPSSGRFAAFPSSKRPLYALAPNLAYRGKVAVLVSQYCYSACEFFTYALHHSGRAAVIGQSATAGAGGSINNVKLPAGVTFYYTQTTAIGPDGVPIIEQRGVAPTVRVPVTQASVVAAASGQDPVLDAALHYLNSHART